MKIYTFSTRSGFGDCAKATLLLGTVGPFQLSSSSLSKVGGIANDFKAKNVHLSAKVCSQNGIFCV